ncbi:MAG: response regulator [Candidatus Dormiibacterota bacterium]
MSMLDLSRINGVRLVRPPAADNPSPPAPADPPAPELELTPAPAVSAAAPAAAEPLHWPVPELLSPEAALNHAAVMIVDDNVRLATTVAAFMEMEGFRVQAAHSAEEALLAAQRAPFDLALIDINMPGIDGIEVCRRLREMLPSLRVLIVTGRDSVEDPQRAAAVGARKLLTKPISLAALRDEMLRALAG